MATLRIPDKNVTLRDPSAIRQFLEVRGIVHARWSADRDLSSEATNEQVLAAYDYLLKPLMDKDGYQTADVIRVDADTPNLEGIREKFIREHSHSEDEGWHTPMICPANGSRAGRQTACGRFNRAGHSL